MPLLSTPYAPASGQQTPEMLPLLQTISHTSFKSKESFRSCFQVKWYFQREQAFLSLPYVAMLEQELLHAL